MDPIQPIDASMFGGPLARLVSHLCDHPGLAPEWAVTELEFLTSAEVLLMAKATMVLERAGVPIDAGLLADASRISAQRQELTERILAFLYPPG